MCESLQENIAKEFGLTSPAIINMYHSSNLDDSEEDRWMVTQLLFWGVASRSRSQQHAASFCISHLAFKHLFFLFCRKLTKGLLTTPILEFQCWPGSNRNKGMTPHFPEQEPALWVHFSIIPITPFGVVQISLGNATDLFYASAPERLPVNYFIFYKYIKLHFFLPTLYFSTIPKPDFYQLYTQGNYLKDVQKCELLKWKSMFLEKKCEFISRVMNK